MADFVFSAPLGAAGGCVSSTNDGDCAIGGRSNNLVHQRLSADGKVGELEHTNRSVKKGSLKTICIDLQFKKLTHSTR